MIEFGFGLILSSFIAGVFTFFAPCTLPLVPAFLGIISGVRSDELSDQEKTKKLRWKIFNNALFYVLGFSLIFILFGLAFSFLGNLLAVRGILQKIGGVFIVSFGLFLIGFLKISWLNSEKHIRIASFYSAPGKLNSFGIGVLFALGWSPCVGPLLGSILFLASGTGTILQGTLLLVVFSIGLGIPFLLTSLLIGKAYSSFNSWSNGLRVINIIAGVFLIFIGVLLISGQFSTVFGKFQSLFYGFEFFERFVNRFL